MIQEMRDEDLMCQYQRGEACAMDELLRRYKNPVYRFALRLSNNHAEAQDICQEVFLRIHQFRQEYTPRGKFSTWIFSIAHNLFVSTYRKRKWTIFWPRQLHDPEEPVEFESLEPSPAQIAAKEDTAETVRQCIQSLPFLQKEALILREYESLDYAQIAKILHKPQGTVKTLIYRARQSLLEKLLPYEDEIKGGNP